MQHKALNLELDIIYIGIFFLTSWLVGSMVDMERAISDRLSRQVNVDDLTGLYNRRFLQEELKRKTEEDNAASLCINHDGPGLLQIFFLTKPAAIRRVTVSLWKWRKISSIRWGIGVKFFGPAVMNLPLL